MDPDAAEGVLETGIVSQAERWPSFCFTCAIVPLTGRKLRLYCDLHGGDFAA